MKKILISLALAVLLAVPTVGLAAFYICVTLDGGRACYQDVGIYDEGAGTYTDPRGTVYGQGQFTVREAIRGETPGMKFTGTECTIQHNLDDYKGCVGLEGATTDLTECCMVDKILTIGDYVFVALLVVAIIFILIAAWGFLTAAGDPDKVKRSQNNLLYALVGIAVAFLAKVAVRVVAGIMM